MTEQEKPLIDRVWEFTKDISVKVSRKAEKHWKINTLRVEIASIRHRINVKFKELGRYVYESVKSQALEEESYKASLREFFDELKRLEGEILQRENRIEILEQEITESDDPKPPPVPVTEVDPDVVDAEAVETLSGDDASEAEDHVPEPPSNVEVAETPEEKVEVPEEGEEATNKTDDPPPKKKRTRAKSSTAKTAKKDTANSD